MREKPILFSAPMVRAILAGTKVQTRRVMVPQPAHLQRHEWRGKLVYEGEHRLWCWRGHTFENIWDEYIREADRLDLSCMSPFGIAGDRLWVRETWWRGRWTEEHHYNDIDGVSRSSVNWCYHKPGDAESIAYAADGDPPGGRTPAIGDHDLCEGWDKMPSIFLPRLDSRITLEVTDVRVQRLQEISEDDARAEGCTGLPDVVDVTPREEFERLWDSINGKRAPWESNPWVWAISFRRVVP